MAKWKADYIMEAILPKEMKEVFENAEKNLKIENVRGWKKKDEEDNQNFNRMVDFVLKQPLNNFASKVFFHVSEMYINDINGGKATPITSDRIVQDLLDKEKGKYKKYIGFENIRDELIKNLRKRSEKIFVQNFTKKVVNLLSTSNCQVYLDDEKKEKEEQLEKLKIRLENLKNKDPPKDRKEKEDHEDRIKD